MSTDTLDHTDLTDTIDGFGAIDDDTTPGSSRPRRKRRTFNDLDVEILRTLVRFGLVRGRHLAGITGASGHTIVKRLRMLKAAGLVREVLTDVDLRQEVTRGKTKKVVLRSTVVTAYQATGKGAKLAGTWQCVGSDATIGLNGPGRSRLQSHHTLGIADLAVWYRWYGFDIASEREIRSLEMPLNTKQSKGNRRFAPVSFWTVKVPGKIGLHPPDLGGVAPDGGVWAVELERATKSVQDYQQVIGAYRAAGMGQIWHIQSPATVRLIMDACARLGIIAGNSPAPGVWVSQDGLVRLQGWAPAWANDGTGPGGWMHPRTGATGDGAPSQMPRLAPSGLPFERLSVDDVTASWRLGREVELDDERGNGWLLS